MKVKNSEANRKCLRRSFAFMAFIIFYCQKYKIKSFLLSSPVWCNFFVILMSPLNFWWRGRMSNLPLKMLPYSIFACIIGQICNPKMSSLAYHFATTDSWRRLLFHAGSLGSFSRATHTKETQFSALFYRFFFFAFSQRKSYRTSLD